MKIFFLFCVLCFSASFSNAQTVWQAGFDGNLRFYQTTDFGILLVGTDNSLYSVDGQNGQKLWRRAHRGLDVTSVTPIPGTDLILLTLDEGKKSRFEAVDLLTGNTLWQSDQVKGDVMQLAVDPEEDLLAVVLVIKGFGMVGKEVKREPVVHVLRLSDGSELWKDQLGSDVELMPAQFGENSGESVAHTLDNYRAPLLLDGRLFLFYEGATSYDAPTGQSRQREEFGVNQDALALTDADPVFDDKNIYISGRGKVRAIDRRTGEVVWKADDLGVTPELAVVGNVLYARTGGQFTSIRDGRVKKQGPFGVSAIDTKTGERIWRYKGADNGLTNFVFSDKNTILIADGDDLIAIDAVSGKRLNKFKHDVEDAQFVLINERGEAVVGGRQEIAAFSISNFENQKIRYSKTQTQNQLVWRVKHKPPSRGVFRVIVGIALRAAALYFRYGGLAASALNFARGASLVRSVLSLRWSGLKTRFSLVDMTTLASNSAANFISGKLRVFGIAAQNPNFLNRFRDLQIQRGIGKSVAKAGSEVREGLLEKLDPVKQIERLSDYFLRRKRLAEFRGNFMYFYTDLPKPYSGKGLVGVNLHNGQNMRFIRVSEPDAGFITDEVVGLLYSANGKQLQAFRF